MEAEILNLLHKIAQMRPNSSTQAFSELPGWDSLKFAELVIGLQKIFRVRLQAADVGQLLHVQATCELIKSRQVADSTI